MPLLRASLLLHMRQRRCRCGEPEGHVHGTVQLDGGGERGAGQCSTACPAVQRAETAVTVRLQRAHAEFPGQGEGVLIVGLGRLDLRRLAPCCDVAEKAQGIRLVTTFLAFTGERQRTLGEGVRLLQAAASMCTSPRWTLQLA